MDDWGDTNPCDQFQPPMTGPHCDAYDTVMDSALVNGIQASIDDLAHAPLWGMISCFLNEPPVNWLSVCVF